MAARQLANGHEIGRQCETVGRDRDLARPSHCGFRRSRAGNDCLRADLCRHRDRVASHPIPDEWRSNPFGADPAAPCHSLWRPIARHSRAFHRSGSGGGGAHLLGHPRACAYLRGPAAAFALLRVPPSRCRKRSARVGCSFVSRPLLRTIRTAPPISSRNNWAACSTPLGSWGRPVRSRRSVAWALMRVYARPQEPGRSDSYHPT